MKVFVEVGHWINFLNKPEWGPLLWKTLHDRPAHTCGHLEQEAEWIEAFTAAIPCDECRGHFRSYLAHQPPDFSSVLAYFRWGWNAHNAVNARLSKPIVPWQNHWGKPAP